MALGRLKSSMRSVTLVGLVYAVTPTKCYGDVNSNTVTYGHIHRPFIRRVGKSTVVNSGSVGLSYDGDQRACYVVIDHSSVTLRRVVYDVEREVQELRGRKYPRAEWLISI